jgi:S1-C subfamily serine protease
VAAALSAACAGGLGARGPALDPGVRAACEQFDPLLDVYLAVQSTAAFGGSNDLRYVVDLDDEAAYVRDARKAVGTPSAPEIRAIADKLEKLEVALDANRKAVVAALAEAEKTFEASESALDAAATCQGVNLRAEQHAGHDADRAASLAQKGCESTVRLWAAARSADLTSDVSSSSVASQIRELTLKGKTGAARDRLAAALGDHSKKLRALHATAAPRSDDVQTPDAQALAALRQDLSKSLESVAQTCQSNMKPTDRIVGGHPDPRSATVTVRPKWTGSLASLPHAEEFGSGFVVRWVSATGAVETRIVTNGHVMDGAFEAEIAPGDADRADKDQKWSASLIKEDPHDDVAVLRLDDGPSKPFAQGLALRLTPAREQEPVVAAGFPGVGVKPSFQVSKGAVSNAKFGAEGSDASTLFSYVQHTAPIDPGNSGGPLLDADGHLIGMNTLKIVGRENVGLAIPAWRVQQALLRADENLSRDSRHVEASCNAVVAALASPHPVADAMSRFGLALYEWAEKQGSSSDEAGYRAGVQGEVENPVEAARLRAYGAVRARVEQEHGVRPFAACTEVKPGSAPSTFVATFATRTGSHQLVFGEEHGLERVVAFQ